MPQALKLEKPLPLPTPVSRPFWDALTRDRIAMQRCAACDGWVFYPRNRCNHCLSDRLTWQDVPTTASLYTYTIARQPTSPHFADAVPQLLAVVELENGVRLTSTLVNVAEPDIWVGMALKAVFDRVSDQLVMLRFEPA